MWPSSSLPSVSLTALISELASYSKVVNVLSGARDFDQASLGVVVVGEGSERGDHARDQQAGRVGIIEGDGAIGRIGDGDDAIVAVEADLQPGLVTGLERVET